MSYQPFCSLKCFEAAWKRWQVAVRMTAEERGGSGGFPALPGWRSKPWRGVGKQRTAWAPCSTMEAPSTCSKALFLQPVTTDRVVSHCNSGIQCRNNFSAAKTWRIFEASSEGRLPERCVFVVIIWICFAGNVKDVVMAGRRQLHWKLLLLFIFFSSCSLTGEIDLDLCRSGLLYVAF